MARSVFFKLIECDNCGYNYRGLKERGKRKYICGGYSRMKEDGCKERFTVEENTILEILRIYCNRNKIELIEDNEFATSIIESIKVNKDTNQIEIQYKNGENAKYGNIATNI